MEEQAGRAHPIVSLDEIGEQLADDADHKVLRPIAVHPDAREPGATPPARSGLSSSAVSKKSESYQTIFCLMVKPLSVSPMYLYHKYPVPPSSTPHCGIGPPRFPWTSTGDSPQCAVYLGTTVSDLRRTTAGLPQERFRGHNRSSDSYRMHLT
jgi:hypothetical protein